MSTSRPPAPRCSGGGSAGAARADPAESTQDVPTVGLPAETSVVDAFLAAGLSDSKSAARRAIKEGGAYINNERVSDGETALPADRALHGRWLLLRRGKRSIAVVDVVG